MLFSFFSPASRVQVEDRFVVEIRIVNCPGLVYMSPGGKYGSFVILFVLLISSPFVFRAPINSPFVALFRCFFRNKSRNEEVNSAVVVVVIKIVIT